MSDMAERQADVTNHPDRGTVPEGRLRSLLLRLIAFAGLVAFLGVLAAWVPRPDLLVWIGLTVLLVAVDFFVRR